ncbi:MAG TPA: PIG-L deacetylase family protein [Pirellulales bacterium]|jgi:LmbE family N-acetylglucosaminyl deacetylase|nr:PIG-L deacetylase family protein [Pirellulales bacterium]
MSSSLRLLILGAHPDDAEFTAGGIASRYRRAGHEVKMVSVTCGDAGHHEMSGPPLAARRRAEAAASAAAIGASSAVWEHPDARLLPTLELRGQIIREIRSFAPDLVLTHRTNDYHPDHRAVAQAVQDASYLVTVPNVEPDTPIVKRDPVVAFLPDRFTRPNPLRADVVLDVSSELERVVAMLACHRSQVFEWLPFNRGTLDQVPTDDPGRLAWLRQWIAGELSARADRFRGQLVATYGSARAAAIEACEVFEVSEYASPLDDAARARLFGWMQSE